MHHFPSPPRVLFVTPEISYVPETMDSKSKGLNAKSGGLADVSAALISALYHSGADVHVAIPNYRMIFNGHLSSMNKKEMLAIRENMPEARIHLAHDRAFYYLNHVYTGNIQENINISLSFQREVINNIVPKVQPDLIHCNDWMTGLIPAMARLMNIPCLFTIHNIHTVKSTLAEIEDRGIDSASFWDYLFYDSFPGTYEKTRSTVPVDFLTSGVFAAHFVNTVSPSFLKELIEGRHHFIPASLRNELANKYRAECAAGILNAPDAAYNPSTDSSLSCPYSADNHILGKITNKRVLQKSLGLRQNELGPLFLWPSRLDPSQKGCQLLAEILYQVVERYRHQHLQMVFVADGEFQKHFKEIVRLHNLYESVAVCDFDDSLSRLAYGASDFVLMPSRFEPCGLPQMIGPIYGSLPVAHDTGGIHDSITHLNYLKNQGNGFLFENFDTEGLFWAIDQAMQFYDLPLKQKRLQIRRIMLQSAQTFSYKVTAQHYIDLYEKMLQRPLIVRKEPIDGKLKWDAPSRFVTAK